MKIYLVIQLSAPGRGAVRFLTNTQAQKSQPLDSKQ